MSSIHHEIKFPAVPSRVYEALVSSKEFSELTGAPASGDGAEGAAFSGFGGCHHRRSGAFVAEFSRSRAPDFR